MDRTDASSDRPVGRNEVGGAAEQPSQPSPGAARPAARATSVRGDSEARLSYKFQRLRERLRAAITSGELGGKLPGERQLARRFRVNAKTLSKALTDLAAEGLLERNIGRGTYVRGSGASAADAAPQRWLLLCDSEMWSPVVDELAKANSACDVRPKLDDPRPSYLSPFTAAIDFCDSTPAELTRELIVRNITVVKVNHVPKTYSTNAVLIDRALGAANLARDLLFQGHRRLFVVENAGQREILPTVQSIAARYDAQATVDVGHANDAAAAVRQAGATAVLCSCALLGAQVRRHLEGAGVDVPNQVALAAVGMTASAPCSGYFVHPAQVAESVVQLILNPQARRPAVIWLNGAFHDAGTSEMPISPRIVGVATGMPGAGAMFGPGGSLAG